MGELEPGLIVAIKFPFSDLTRTKLRPAIVLAGAGKDDFVLCQITSKPYSDVLAVMLEETDFAEGRLPLTSYVRPGKLFTAHKSLIEKSLGKTNAKKKREVVNTVCKLLHSGISSEVNTAG